MNDELQAEINRARERGQIAAANEPRAIRAWYDESSKKVFVELIDGLTIGVPHEKLQGLQDATAGQLSQVEITPSGYGLHWKALDADLEVPQIVAGLFGTKIWMAELGRQGGKSKSEAKARASQKNGSLGGRPPTAHQDMQKEQS
jgi:hypothetical protein